jgi:hypothetical protein
VQCAQASARYSPDFAELRRRAVADIVPIGASRANEQISGLISEGRITPASRPRPKRSPRLAASGRSASDLVLAERDDER